MININMTVEIDILADDDLMFSRSEFADMAMSMIAEKTKELFDAPLSSNAELLDITIFPDYERSNHD